MKNVFFLVGPHGVGKTYTVTKLKELEQVEHIDLGPLIRQAHQVFAPNKTLGEWIEEGESKYGKNFTDIILCKQIERITKGKEAETTIITGSRSLNGIQYICNRFSIENSPIIYITAPFEQLKSNYERREKKNLTPNQFYQILQAEKEMGLEALEEYAKQNGIYLQNDNTDAFIRNIQNIIAKRKKKEEECR